MRSLNKQGDERSLPMGTELTKALIQKTIDNGKATEENTKLLVEIGELIRKLPDPGNGIRELGERLGNLWGFADTVKKDTNGWKAVVEKLVARETIPPAVIEGLREDMRQHAQLFEKPLEKRIHHTHLLGRPLQVLGGMILVIATMVFFWIRTWQRADRNEEGDIKWRFMKLDTNAIVRRVFASAEFEYKTSPGQFRDEVKAEEDRRKELFAGWEQNDTVMQQIYDFKTKEIKGTK